MKKSKQIIGLILAVSIAILSTSCSQDKKESPLSPVLYGEGPPSGSTPANPTFIFDLNNKSKDYSDEIKAHYDPSCNTTFLRAYKTDLISFTTISLTFPGKITGTFTEKSHASVMYINSYMQHFGSIHCTITITDYCPVGGRIKGTFSAVLTNYDAITSNQIISNGIFEVTRGPDESMI
ncbi:MAG: hypothetical protein KKH98_00075 [Spirochaetes bacterium]|nr:hypothetical protein [Spirochaetota bacterium]